MSDICYCCSCRFGQKKIKLSFEIDFLPKFLNYFHPAAAPYLSSPKMSTPKPIRTASISRKTNETSIECSITLDHPVGVKQIIEINTGIGFLDHVSLPVSLSTFSSPTDTPYNCMVDVSRTSETCPPFPLFDLQRRFMDRRPPYCRR